jgi:hypothetical protein
MTGTNTTRLPSLEDVRASVKRVRDEGERFVGRLQRDARTLVQKGTRPVVADALADARRLRADVRKRASQAIKDLDQRRSHLAKAVEDRLVRLAAETARRLRLPTREEIDTLTRRVNAVEGQLQTLLKQQKATEKAA